ncbi:MAG: hypothetical protein MUP63_01380 [Candidatus Nanohaloarchaeota archaeon QJJ-7]|nr:hypothetical protein [Candidatus Nanohaloarchaeota archaeon QJJ-7]
MVDVPDEVDKEDLAFPHSRIVNMVRDETKDGQYVRKSVYHGLNLLLGNIAEDIIDKLVQTDAAYIEKHDLDRASRKYENIEEVMEEKERIIKHLRALEEDVNKLSRDIERAGMD